MRLSPLLVALAATGVLLGGCSKTAGASAASSATAQQAAAPAAAARTPTNWAAVWTKTDQMPPESLQQDPGALASWHAVVPAKFAKTDWVYDLRGGSGSPKIMTENGHAFAVGGACERHSCGDNLLAFVIQVGGGRAAGATLIMPDKGGSIRTYFGDPTPVEKQWLDTVLAK